MTRVIVLRPEPGASETVARAQALGLHALSIPLFEIEPVAWAMPNKTDYDGLLLTSVNALRHGGAKLHSLTNLPAYAVGEATAEAARAAGFRIERAGESGVDRLLQSMAPHLKLLHLCGEDHKSPNAAEQIITAVPVYRAAARDVALKNVSEAVALIHSPRAARRFADLIGDRSTVAIAAISSAAADAAGAGWARIAAAEQPTDEALLALAARLCNTSPAK